jgi:hypothetical protein
MQDGDLMSNLSSRGNKALKREQGLTLRFGLGTRASDELAESRV